MEAVFYLTVSLLLVACLQVLYKMVHLLEIIKDYVVSMRVQLDIWVNPRVAFLQEELDALEQDRQHRQR